MPTLQNVRYERFAQNIATSTRTKWSNGRCYSEAGFKTDDRSADACAARLLTRANIQARIAELVEPTARRTRATIDTLSAQLDEVFTGATGDRQWGAAGSAAALKAKLLGFMRERLEVGHVGEFDACTSSDEVIEKLLSRHESPAAALAELDELRTMIEDYASSHVAVVRSDRAQPQAPGTERSLALWRRRR